MLFMSITFIEPCNKIWDQGLNLQVSNQFLKPCHPLLLFAQHSIIVNKGDCKILHDNIFDLQILINTWP